MSVRNPGAVTLFDEYRIRPCPPCRRSRLPHFQEAHFSEPKVLGPTLCVHQDFKKLVRWNSSRRILLRSRRVVGCPFEICPAEKWRTDHDASINFTPRSGYFSECPFRRTGHGGQFYLQLYGGPQSQPP